MLDDQLLKTVTKSWNLKSTPEFVRYVANYIYYCPSDQVYVRLTETTHRSVELIESELHWMKHLENEGINFAHAIPSQAGQLCENFSSHDCDYIASVFKEARGSKVIHGPDFTKDVLFQWGELTGKLHKATKSYQRPAHIMKRHDWINEEYHKDIQNLITNAHGKVYEEAQRLENYFLTLEKTKENYGLIHGDIHNGNFHIDESGHITLFDFDDCVYHWFIYDIAVIFWSIESKCLDPMFVCDHFYKGYFKESELAKEELSKLPDFYNYRMVMVYGFCLKLLKENKIKNESKQMIKNLHQRVIDYFDSDRVCPFIDKNSY